MWTIRWCLLLMGFLSGCEGGAGGDTATSDTAKADMAEAGLTDTVFDSGEDTSGVPDPDVATDTYLDVRDTWFPNDWDTSTPTDADTIEHNTSDTSPADTSVVPDDITSDLGSDSSADDSDTGQHPATPAITYRTENPRTLFFLNNPEQLKTTELGDSDLMDTTLLRVTAHGPSRSFFEHINKSGRTIGFGVQAYNPGPGTATLSVEGLGFTVGIEGGRPFAAALSGEGGSTLSLAAGQSAWLLRRDESVPSGSFFSGVVDFTVTGSVIVNHIAYDRFDRLDGSTAERDYVTRIEPDGTSEARMYKGVASASEAVLELDVFVDDQMSGPISVITRPFDLASGTYLTPVITSSWVSHIGPSQNAASSVTDMASFVFRTWTFDPLVRSDAEGKYPNLGNWGLVYRLSVVVENRGARDRSVSWRVQASPGAGAGLAKRTLTGSAGPDPRGGWTSHQLAAGATLTMATVSVPAGQTRLLEGAMVLGGPSGGALRNSLVAD